MRQSNIYTFAAHLARQFGCSYILDIGCGTHTTELARLIPEFQIVGVDTSAAVAACQRKITAGHWIEWDFDSAGLFPFDPEIVSSAVVICTDLIQRVQYPEYLLENIRWLLNTAPVALISTPERDLISSGADFHPSIVAEHIHEWNLQEFSALLATSGLKLDFVGLTTNETDGRKQTILAIAANQHSPARRSAPDDFEVVALMTSYNEADIIAPSLHQLITSGIKVYLIDNWSTDGTVEIARSFLGKGLIGIEQYPLEGRADYYHWAPLLHRKEEVARDLQADWYIHTDVDEYREAPWSDMTLRDGLYHVDECGFNAVDFTLVNFALIDNSFPPGSDYVKYFRHWEFGERPGHFIQVKAWKNTSLPVDLTSSGGHLATFDNQRIYPYKFLNRHYTFRTDAQARRKIRAERIAHPDEAGKWHTHIDLYKELESFVRDPRELHRFDQDFYTEYLVERLSGINILPEDGE